MPDAAVLHVVSALQRESRTDEIQRVGQQTSRHPRATTGTQALNRVQVATVTEEQLLEAIVEEKLETKGKNHRALDK
jgi:hypothetical protein